MYRERNWLYHEYYEKGRTLTEIADQFGVDHTTISKWRQKHSIPKQSRQISLECPVCGNSFSRSRSRVERAKHVNVCSRDCLHEARRRGLFQWRDSIMKGDARSMDAVPDESVDLVVTSPPYHVSGFTGRPDYSDYDDSQGIEEWESLMEETLSEVFRVTKPDAKVCLVLGTSKSTDKRFQQHRLAAHAYNLGRDVGFDYLDGIVWIKRNYANSGGRERPLFGSYPYPTNMLITQNHEQILVFRKWVDEDYYSQRELPAQGSEKKENSRLGKEEWREYAQSQWEIKPVKNGEHPAQFPVELVSRLIKLYSFHGDTVLDPFCGAGTTPVAAVQEGRHYCGYEISAEYCELARERIVNVDDK